MLSRALIVSSQPLVNISRHVSQASIDPLQASIDAIKEKDLLCDATANYRELSIHDKMNDYIIDVNNSGGPYEPNDPKRREPVLENAIVSQYDTEQATISLSSHTYPNLPNPNVVHESHPYSWLAQGSFDSLRQSKFLSARLLGAHQSRHYHSGRSLQGVQAIPARRATIHGTGIPQGVQGYHCENSVIWKRSCDVIYNRCMVDNRIVSDRQTLSQVLSEQMNEIEDVQK